MENSWSEPIGVLNNQVMETVTAMCTLIWIGPFPSGARECPLSQCPQFMTGALGTATLTANAARQGHTPACPPGVTKLSQASDRPGGSM